MDEGMQPGPLMLSIDTCGPSGSVALGRLVGGDLELLGQTELAGRTYSTTLVSAVAELLSANRIALKDLGGIIAVSGPGSFTGVRVGLSAVKGLAEGAQIPVVAISRLLVLSHKTGMPSCALDAHRDEVFLRFEEMGNPAKEMLAGLRELSAIHPAPISVAVCDESAAGSWQQLGLRRRSFAAPRLWPATRSDWANRGCLQASMRILPCSMATICVDRMRKSSVKQPQ
jgi:tRNA threonylcarbamoyladenosine biosynthesis protein TsaB